MSKSVRERFLGTRISLNVSPQTVEVNYGFKAHFKNRTSSTMIFFFSLIYGFLSWHKLALICTARLYTQFFFFFTSGEDLRFPFFKVSSQKNIELISRTQVSTNLRYLDWIIYKISSGGFEGGVPRALGSPGLRGGSRVANITDFSVEVRNLENYPNS